MTQQSDNSAYPQYYEYDDIPVVVDVDKSTGKLIYKNWAGIESESARKAPFYGNRTNQEAFEAVSDAYKRHLADKTISEKQFNETIEKYYNTKFYCDYDENGKIINKPNPR